MADIIAIDKNKIPYKFDIKFENGIFRFKISYNKFNDRIYIELYDTDDNVIFENEMLQFGMPCWLPQMIDNQNNLNPDYPNKFLVPLSASGEELPVNILNIGESVFLSIQEVGLGNPTFEYRLYLGVD